MTFPAEIQRVSETVWQLPVSFKEGMRVPARIFATEKLLRAMDQTVFDQLTNVATLPGIIDYANCMPDGHSGYGFPIGGVAAMDPDNGVISPGGIGFDINCGMRLVRTNLTLEQVKPRLHKLVDALFNAIPAGVGRAGLINVSRQQFPALLEQGAGWCVDRGYGWREDLEYTEEQGCMAGADPAKVSDRAVERGYQQIGTLGSGNHYLEIQTVKPENIFAPDLAARFGITKPNQVVIMFHCGSRGFGHQVASDYLQTFLRVMKSKYNLTIRDRELSCAPFRSPEGQDYFAAMVCAVNMAFANRQGILHRIREVFAGVFGRDPRDLDMHQIYDVCHNTAKLETHQIHGRQRQVLVHRKGATRAFGPGMADLPGAYRDVGQPVIIGGSMETGSYLLCGLPTGRETFFSTAHGSGRAMSRHAAKRQFDGRQLQQDLLNRGIYVHACSYAGLAEEAGGAYKDIDEVVAAAERSGLSRPVVRFTPIGNIKG